MKKTRPELIVLIGLPGSGKTTYAKRYVEAMGKCGNVIRLSSDSIRAELYGDESVQGNPEVVFSTMRQRALDALSDGVSVVYDATNVTRKDRASIMSVCPKYVSTEAHIIWAPIEDCIMQDASRKRTVGKAVIDKMLKRFQAPWYDEGFHAIDLFHESLDMWSYTRKCLDTMDIPHDNPHHEFGVKDHCLTAEKFAKDNGYNDDIIWAARWHDVAKPYTKEFVDGKGNPSETAHFYQHHCAGSYMSYGLSGVSFYRAWLISTHMDPFLNTKYYNNLPALYKNDIDLLHQCDLNAH